MERVLSVTLLGAVQAFNGGEVIDLGTSKQRAVFALMALQVGEIVTSESIAEVLWGGRPPGNAGALLHTYVARLRRVLEPDAPRHARNNIIASASGGYRLRLPPHRIDLIRFRRLVEAAGELVRQHREAAAFELLTAAVAIWADPELTRLKALLPGSQAPAALRREWVNACLQLVTVALDLGRPADAVRVAGRLATAEPLHEVVQAGHIRALARSGDTAGAMQRYVQVRTRLATELGIEPGPELIACGHELEHGTASGNPAGAASVSPPSPPHAPGLEDPPADDLIGRDEDLTAVARMIAGNRVVTVAGPAGCGKSALAASLLRRAEAVGGVTVDVSRLATPADARTEIEHRLPATAVDGLLLLDNVDHLTDTCAALVDDLVRANRCGTILVTSREPLGLAYETVWRLRPLPTAGAGPGGLRSAPAVRLFARRAAQARPGFRLSERDLATASAICARLDGLPLAIELAAQQMVDESAENLLRRLDDLGPTAAGDLPVARAVVFKALERSLDSLTPAERWCFSRLGELPRQFRLSDADRVCRSAAWWRTGTQILLDGLVRKSLLIVRSDGKALAYVMLPTVHRFAAMLGAA